MTTDEPPTIEKMSATVWVSEEFDRYPPGWLEWMLRPIPWAERERVAIEEAALRRRLRRAWMALRLRLADAIYPPSERDE
jgi:hypothetical protein